MYKCKNPDCGKQAVYLLEGGRCKHCFIPPTIPKEDMPETEVVFKNLKTIPCYHCRRKFKQTQPMQGFCSPECKRLDGNRRSKEQREELKQ